MWMPTRSLTRARAASACMASAAFTAWVGERKAIGSPSPSRFMVGETAEQLRRLPFEVAPGKSREAPSASHQCSSSVVSKKTSSTASHS